MLKLVIIISLLFNLPLFAWVKCFGTDADDWGNSVCENIWMGGYLIGGTTVFSEGNLDAYFLSINGNGGIEWSYNYGNPESLEIINAIHQSDYDGGEGMGSNLYILH